MFTPKGLSPALAGLLAMAAFAVHAQRVTLDEAVQRTLADHPALRAEAASARAIAEQAMLEGLAPAPTVSAELENVLGTGEVSGIRAAETTLRLGQVLELGGKRDARRARGSAMVERQRNISRQRQLDLALATTLRYIAVTQGQRELELADRQWRVAQATERFVRERVERGAAPEGDIALAQIAQVRAEIDREHAEHELAGARFALAALWGEASALPIETTGDLDSLPESPDFETLAKRLEASPESVAWTLETRRIEAERAVADASARPDLSLALGVRRLEAFDDQALVMSVSMPLGTRSRATHLQARADAELDAIDAQSAAALLEARQTLFARVQELRHARTEFEALSSRMIPAAERGLSLTRAGYEEARYSILELTQAQTTLLKLQHERLDAAARHHRILAEIERSTALAGDRP